MYLSDELKKEINSVLNQGGVIAFVTDTVWGLGSLPNSKEGVSKIYEIKKRESQKPLILMSDEVDNLIPFVKEINTHAQELIDKYFPGALTLVMDKSDKTPDYITSGFDTVGIRVPDNGVFKEICSCIEGGVLATTSANLSHEPSAKTYEQAIENMGQKADLVISDYGVCAKGLESTVALVKNNEVKILRQGVIEL